MIYERFTSKGTYGSYTTRCVDCKYKDECEGYDVDCEDYLLKELGRLEDKIENGTLIELPCKVGDTFYCIDLNRSACYDCEHYSSFYGTDEMCENGCAIYPEIEIRKPKCDRHFLEVNNRIFSLSWYDIHVNDFNKTWFLTKAEAEKKLKELIEL